MILLAPPAGAKAPESNAKVVLFGSSSMNDSFGHIIAYDLTRRGYRVVRKGYAAAGLSRPDFRDVFERVPELPVAGAAVIMYLGGNDAQTIWLRPEERENWRDAWIKWEEERWSTVYESRVRALVDALCVRGAARVVVLPPVDVARPRMQQRLDRIRRLQKKGAAASRCGRFVPTAGDRGKFERATQALRARDGVHMTREGALQVWKRISAPVLRLIERIGAAEAASS